MINFAEKVGFPTTLSEIEGFGQLHIERALAAAKNPQLKSKLENMPVPLSYELVDEYMGSILEAAQRGNPEIIRNL
jgi:alcohol dehydrogenase